MRGLLGALTVRGRSFVAAGVAAFGAGRARYRLSCVRTVEPARLPAGQAASLTIKLSNVSRLRTGLLLAEDTVPYALGSRPRFVFDGIGAGGARSFSYQV